MENKDDIMKKWAPLLSSIAGDQSAQDSMLPPLHPTESESEFDNFPSLLPTAIKISAKTLGSELGVFASSEEIDRVKSRVIQENRDGKLGSILEDKPFNEKKLEDDEEYKELQKKGVKPMSAPSGNLFYIDFKYGDSNSTTN